MSYCKFGEDSDVYVYDGGTLICCGCKIREKFHTDFRSEMILHLQLHMEKGHKVPDQALDTLRKEIKGLGNDVSEDEV